MKDQSNALIAFSKIYPDKDVNQLIELAHESGFEGYDLCLRPGFPIHMENVRQRLPEAHQKLQAAGLSLPMISCNLTVPQEPEAELLLEAMDKSDVRLLKLGYKKFAPLQQNYWTVVDETRREIAGWAALGEKYGVRICIHTHSTLFACNCASLMHLLKDFDPRWFGAYIDPAHMLMEGENFSMGAAMTRDYLCAVGLKDALVRQIPKADHGGSKLDLGVEAGKGMVDWTEVFSTLAAFAFKGFFSAHCTVLNYSKIPPDNHAAYIRAECAFFKQKREQFFRIQGDRP